ncbi:hypothetical protein R1sor_026305 [Riccia sorocarpa]|uniref:Uncharacterized protein n=1 Tax=Riccia sorocarpa TaxID=122646 RepID=A0ABD3GDU7_9MARC
MGSQSRRHRMVDRKRTDQLGQSSRPIAQANEDRLRLRRQRSAEQQAKRRAASNSEHVASGSQRGIRRKVMEMVDKLKSLSCESVEYESKILTCFLKHSSISKALKVGEIMSLKEQRAAKLLLANLATGLQIVKRTHTQDDMIHDDCKEICREMGWGETAELGELAKQMEPWASDAQGSPQAFRRNKRHSGNTKTYPTKIVFCGIALVVDGMLVQEISHKVAELPAVTTSASRGSERAILASTTSSDVSQSDATGIAEA